MKLSSQSLVRYRTNDYSTPVAYGHRDVWVGGHVDQAVIGGGGEIIARHPRYYDRENMIFDPVHCLPLIGGHLFANPFFTILTDVTRARSRTRSTRIS